MQDAEIAIIIEAAHIQSAPFTAFRLSKTFLTNGTFASNKLSTELKARMPNQTKSMHIEDGY